jgi:hypothetical protein
MQSISTRLFDTAQSAESRCKMTMKWRRPVLWGSKVQSTGRCVSERVIGSSRDDQLESVDPLPARTRNASNGVALGWKKHVPDHVSNFHLDSEQLYIPRTTIGIPINLRPSSKGGQDLESINPQPSS